MNMKETTATMPATVLIVDDDPGVRLLIGTALEMAGFRVSAAADGAGALAEYRAQDLWSCACARNTWNFVRR